MTDAEGKQQREGICYIIGAGECSRLDIRLASVDYVIAADGGYAHALRFGLPVDLVIGDMDSLGETPSHLRVVRHPVMKDDSNMMLAVKEGLTMGFRVFEIWGSLGGRPDHAFANYQALVNIAQRGCRSRLTDGVTTITVIHDGELCLEAMPQGTISVFAYGKAYGVTIQGLRYTLDHATLSDDLPLGLSNAFIGLESAIRVERGTLLIMWSPS